MKKKSCNYYSNAWYYIQCSHDSQYVEVYELSLAPKLGCMAYEEVAVYFFHNFMNIQHWISWNPDKFPSSSLVPRCAPYGVATPFTAAQCQLQQLQTYELKKHLHMKWYVLQNVVLRSAHVQET